jgi:uncharacterized membrane protein
MSTVSQTPARAPVGFGLRFGLSIAAAVGVLALAMGNVLEPVATLAAKAHPHLPDLALFAALSPVIQIHLLAALAALVLGGVLMVVRKGRTFHRVAGWVWVSLVMVTAGATIFIRELNHGSWSWLHLFTGWVLLITPLAVFWAKRHDVRRHRRTMMGLFHGGFAINLAFAFIPGRTLWMMFFG